MQYFSETEILFKLFFEKHKHVFLVLAILIILLAAFTFFQLREIDNKTIIVMEPEKLKTEE